MLPALKLSVTFRQIIKLDTKKSLFPVYVWTLHHTKKLQTSTITLMRRHTMVRPIVRKQLTFRPPVLLPPVSTVTAHPAFWTPSKEPERPRRQREPVPWACSTAWQTHLLTERDTHTSISRWVTLSPGRPPHGERMRGPEITAIISTESAAHRCLDGPSETGPIDLSE